MLVEERGEAVARAQEVTVVAQLDGECERAQQVAQAPVAGLQEDQAFGREGGVMAGEFAGEAAGVGGVIQRGVVDDAAGGALRIAEVTHGGEEIGDAQAVLGDGAGFLAQLRLQDGVLGGVEAVERGGRAVELVAEHDDEVADHAVGLRAVGKAQRRAGRAVVVIAAAGCKAPGARGDRSGWKAALRGIGWRRR